jgi:predicted MFS family arabinose efflux permease
VTSSPVVAESSPHYVGWRVVFACFVAAIFAWGFGFYGHSVYIAELHRLHGWPTSLISGATTAYYLLGGLLITFVSDAVAKLGPRRLLLAGMACFAVSMGLLAVTQKPWQLYGALLVMSFGWVGMSLGAITNILGLWFDARRGMAISLALNGASFSGILVAPALVFLIEASDFRTGLLIATAAMLAIMTPVVLFCVGRPPRAAAPTQASIAADAQWTRPRALRSWKFWSICTPFALALLAQVGFLVHLISILEPGMGRERAGVALAVMSVMAVIGRVGLGTVIDRLNQRIVTAVALASQAIALLVVMNSAEVTVLFVAVAVFGLSVGNLITLPALIVQREFPSNSFGPVIALSTAINQFTYALGPALMGAVRDLSGGYTAVLAICMAAELLAGAIILFRPKPG